MTERARWSRRCAPSARALAATRPAGDRRGRRGGDVPTSRPPPGLALLRVPRRHRAALQPRRRGVAARGRERRDRDDEREAVARDLAARRQLAARGPALPREHLVRRRLAGHRLDLPERHDDGRRRAELARGLRRALLRVQGGQDERDRALHERAHGRVPLPRAQGRRLGAGAEGDAQPRGARAPVGAQVRDDRQPAAGGRARHVRRRDRGRRRLLAVRPAGAARAHGEMAGRARSRSSTGRSRRCSARRRALVRHAELGTYKYGLAERDAAAEHAAAALRGAARRPAGRDVHVPRSRSRRPTSS